MIYSPTQELEKPPEPHDSHVQLAHKTFRDVGFTLAAMEFPRSPEALAAMLAYNRVPPNFTYPFGWGFHPNAWSRDHWQDYFPNFSGSRPRD